MLDQIGGCTFPDPGGLGILSASGAIYADDGTSRWLLLGHGSGASLLKPSNAVVGVTECDLEINVSSPRLHLDATRFTL